MLKKVKQLREEKRVGGGISQRPLPPNKKKFEGREHKQLTVIECRSMADSSWSTPQKSTLSFSGSPKWAS